MSNAHSSLVFVLFLYCTAYFFIPWELSTGVKNDNNNNNDIVTGTSRL